MVQTALLVRRAGSLLVATFLLLSFGSGPALSQDEDAVDEAGTTKVLTRYDLTIPDVPALEVLGTDPRGLLQPSTRRELALAVGGFDFTDFALEVAPWLLGKDGNISLQEYRKRAWLMRTRLSMGVATPEGEDMRLGVGLRLGLIDEIDPLTDEAYLAPLYDFADSLADVRTEARRKLGTKLHNKTAAQREALIEAEAGPRLSAIRTRMDAYVAEAIEEAKSRWNRRVLELGFALGASSPDSAFADMRAFRYQAWITSGHPLGRSGHLVVGGSAGWERGANNRLDVGQGALAVRGEVGSNTMKGVLELNSHWEEDSHGTHGGFLGLDLELVAPVWLEARLGLDKQPDEDAKLTSGVRLQYGTPQSRRPASGI